MKLLRNESNSCRVLILNWATNIAFVVAFFVSFFCNSGSVTAMVLKARFRVYIIKVHISHLLIIVLSKIMISCPFVRCFAH